MLTEQDIKNINLQIGEKLKFYRKKIHGMTQSELAEIAGVKRTTITNIECGNQKIPLHVLFNLAIALKISISELLPNIKDFTSKKVIPIESIEHGSKIKVVSSGLATIVNKIIDETD